MKCTLTEQVKRYIWNTCLSWEIEGPYQQGEHDAANTVLEAYKKCIPIETNITKQEILDKKKHYSTINEYKEYVKGYSDMLQDILEFIKSCIYGTAEEQELDEDMQI